MGDSGKQQVLRSPQSLSFKMKTSGFSGFQSFHPTKKNPSGAGATLEGPPRALGPRQAGSWRLSAKATVPACSRKRDSSGGHRDLDAAVLRALPVTKAHSEPSPLELLVYLCQ